MEPILLSFYAFNDILQAKPLQLKSGKILDNSWASFQSIIDIVKVSARKLGCKPVLNSHKIPSLEEKQIIILLSDPTRHFSDVIVFRNLMAEDGLRSLGSDNQKERRVGQYEKINYQPILTIGYEDIMNLFTENDESETSKDDHIRSYGLDPRFKFLDSSIWHRYVPVYPRISKLEAERPNNENYDIPSKATGIHSFKTALEKELAQLVEYHRKDLYQTNAAKATLEFQLRMLREPISFEKQNYAKSVTPLRFHSETQMQIKSDKLLQEYFDANGLRDTLQWRFFLVNDEANTGISKVDGKIKISKKNLIHHLLDGFDIEIDYPLENDTKDEEEDSAKIDIIGRSLSKLSGPLRYDILLLDYLLTNTHTQVGQEREYGHEFLEQLKKDSERANPKLKPNSFADYWIFPISSFSSPIYDNFRQLGLEKHQSIWHFAGGGDPINTPHLFRLNFLSFLQQQIKEILADDDYFFKILPNLRNKNRTETWTKKMVLVLEQYLSKVEQVIANKEESLFAASISPLLEPPINFCIEAIDLLAFPLHRVKWNWENWHTFFNKYTEIFPKTIDKLKSDLFLILSNPSVLVVDDEKDFHRDIKIGIKEYFKFESAFSINQMYNCLQSTSFDLILLDLKLDKTGKSGGLLVLKEIREKYPHIPVVIITSEGEVETVMKATELGASHYLHKEKLNYELWRAAIEKAIKNSPTYRIEKADLSLGQKELSPQITLKALKEKKEALEELPNLEQEINALTIEIAKIESELAFERNKMEGFKLQHIKFSNALIFDEINWQFQPKVNVLLGKNGFGKTLILRLIAMLLQYSEKELAETLRESTSQCKLEMLVSNMDKSLQKEAKWKLGIFNKRVGKIPLLAISDARYLPQDVESFSAQPPSQDFDLLKNGAYFFIERKFEIERHKNFFWRLGYELFSRDGEPFKRTELLALLEKVIQDLSGNEAFRFINVEEVSRGDYKITVRVNDTDDDIIPLQWASRGMVSILSIFTLIYFHLEELAKARKKPTGKVADTESIVIIDEIDAHLHPSWQRKILFLLEEYFPNVQFIVSSHSPLVVAGRRRGEVAILVESRDKKHYKINQPDSNFIGASMNDLFQEVFDIYESLDIQFLKFWNELNKFPHLLSDFNSNKINAEEFAKKIQEEIEKVDKDMLDEIKDLRLYDSLDKSRRIIALEFNNKLLDLFNSDYQIIV